MIIYPESIIGEECPSGFDGGEVDSWGMRLEEISGISFQMKDFRSTLASMTVNGDLSRLPLVSEQLRHTKIETTRKFYTRIEAGSAGKRLRDIWMENPVIVHENPVIRERFDNTGYG